MRQQPKQVKVGQKVQNATIILAIAISGFASIAYPSSLTQALPYVVWICLEAKNNKDK